MKYFYIEDGLPFYYSLLHLTIWACLNYPFIYGIFLFLMLSIEYCLDLYKREKERIFFDLQANID